MKLPSAPRLPFLGLALAAVAGIIVADFFPLRAIALIAGIVTIIALGGLALLCWPRLVPTYLFVAAAFFLLHMLQTTNTPGQWLAGRLGERPRAVVMTGAVVTEPKPTAGGAQLFLFELRSVELEGRVDPAAATVLVRWRGQTQFGDELRLFGIVEPIEGPRNPGELDMRAYLARHDVYQRLFVRYAEDGSLIRQGGGDFILRLAQKSRARISQIICRGLEDAPEVQGLIGGITLGLRHQATEDIEEPFQQTGTLHLFAVAGLHVGIVAWLLVLAAKVVRLPQRWASALIIPLLLFYAAVTGLHVSSVRAAVMSSFLIGGFFFERKVLPLNSLAAAAFLLLAWNTNDLFSSGFQLSFAVVGTILLLSEPIATIFRRWTAPDPFLPRSLIRGGRLFLDYTMRKIGGAAAVSLTAWIGSMVLILWYFYLVTPISLLANLAVVPIAYFILATALLSLLVAPISAWLSLVFNNANWFLARAVILLVHLFARVPTGHYYMEHLHWPNAATCKINVLDYGPGAATHLRTRTGDWLFDCASERDYERGLRDYLHATGVNDLAGVLLTHGDSAHIGGAERLLWELRPLVFLDNPAPDRSKTHRRLRGLFADNRVAVKQLRAGDSFELDRDVKARVLFPPNGFTAAAADDQSLVMQVVAPPGVRILFMSDSGVATESALLESGIDLRSEILVKGQNHSEASGSERFLKAVQPVLVIATSRDFPESERIKDEWAGLLQRNGIRLFRQDRTGGVQLRFRPNDWEARAYLTGETFRSASR